MKIAMHVPELIQNPLGYWEVAQKPTEKELEDYYAQKYYQECKGAHQNQYSADELNFYRAKAAQKAAMVDKLFPTEGIRTYLDVGCGEGFELNFFHEQGWKVKGIDFSSNGLEKQNPQCLPFLEAGNIYELLDQEIASGKQYSVVWLQNVLEHVLDPQALLKQLLQLVEPTGCAVISVPNDFSELQKNALENGTIHRPFWVALPDHLSYFDAKSLKATVSANGWICEAVMADFPIDWFLMNSAANYIEDKTVGKAAHHARVALENLIQQQAMPDILNFWCALADIGMGRNITAFIRPNKTQPIAMAI